MTIGPIPNQSRSRPSGVVWLSFGGAAVLAAAAALLLHVRAPRELHRTIASVDERKADTRVTPQSAPMPIIANARSTGQDVTVRTVPSISTNAHAEPPSWRAAREAQLEVIRHSGPMAPRDEHQAMRIFLAWRDLAGFAAESSNGECYHAGCFITFDFENAADATQFDQKVLSATDPSRAWPGPRQRLEPVLGPNDSVSTTWLLLPGASQ